MNESNPKSKLNSKENKSSITNFSNILSDLAKLNERLEFIRNEFNKSVSLIKDSKEEKEKIEKQVNREIDTIREESKKTFNEMQETLKSHEKKQNVKSNQLQTEMTMLKKHKNELSNQLANLIETIAQVEKTVGTDY